MAYPNYQWNRDDLQASYIILMLSKQNDAN
jgi:hypothetical protein